MIRAVFHKEVEGLSDEEWSQHVAEAMYVESFRAKLVGIELAQIMAKLFAPTKTNKGKKKP